MSTSKMTACRDHVTGDWPGRCEGVLAKEIRRLFRTTTLPTAWRAAATATMVREGLDARNPGGQIESEDEKEGPHDDREDRS